MHFGNSDGWIGNKRKLKESKRVLKLRESCGVWCTILYTH